MCVPWSFTFIFPVHSIDSNGQERGWRRLPAIRKSGVFWAANECTRSLNLDRNKLFLTSARFAVFMTELKIGNTGTARVEDHSALERAQS
jgi:hypothetical protein